MGANYVSIKLWFESKFALKINGTEYYYRYLRKHVLFWFLCDFESNSMKLDFHEMSKHLPCPNQWVTMS